jgi:hypothetical protein
MTILNEAGAPFWLTARWFNIKPLPEDLEYIGSAVKKCPIFNLVNCCSEINTMTGIQEPESKEVACKELLCYERFYNDKKCPKGFKLVLLGAISLRRSELTDKYVEFRRLYIGRWFETVLKKE